MPTVSAHLPPAPLFRPIILLSALVLAVSATALAEAPTPATPTPPVITGTTPPAVPEASDPGGKHSLLRVEANFGRDPFKGMSPELVNKLSADDIRTIMLEQARNGQEAEDVRIPLAFFLFLGAVICAGVYSSFRKDRQRHETLRLMVEKGAQIPPELIQPPARPRNDLRRGLLLVATGIGLALLLRFNSGDGHDWSMGLLPMLIGVGYLVAWRLEPKPRPLSLS